jgi:hypothetical protein
LFSSTLKRLVKARLAEEKAEREGQAKKKKKRKGEDADVRSKAKRFGYVLRSLLTALWFLRHEKCLGVPLHWEDLCAAALTDADDGLDSHIRRYHDFFEGLVAHDRHASNDLLDAAGRAVDRLDKELAQHESLVSAEAAAARAARLTSALGEWVEVQARFVGGEAQARFVGGEAQARFVGGELAVVVREPERAGWLLPVAVGFAAGCAAAVLALRARR